MLCGCSTAVHCSQRSPKSHWASMSSRPLFASVAESTVIFGPIAQFGCLSASAGVTFASLSPGQAPDGPRAGGKRRGIVARRGVAGVFENADVADVELPRDRGEFFPAIARGDRDEFELVAMRRKHAQGVFADGAGGAEEDDAF